MTKLKIFGMMRFLFKGNISKIGNLNGDSWCNSYRKSGKMWEFGWV